MNEIIEQKKLKGSSRKPKYATRKLSIGLVSCMLGFTILVSPSDAWAEEATIVPIGTEETFEIVPQAEEPDDIVPLAEESIFDEPVEESIFTEKQKQRLIKADFTEEELKELEIEAKEKKAIEGEAFDVDEFINDKIAERQNSDLEFSLEGAETLSVRSEEEKIEISPANTPSAVGDAAAPEDTSTSADAKNAVHGFVGVLVGGDINADLAAETGQRFKPIEGVKVYSNGMKQKETEHHQLTMQFQEPTDSSILR